MTKQRLLFSLLILSSDIILNVNADCDPVSPSCTPHEVDNQCYHVCTANVFIANRNICENNNLNVSSIANEEQNDLIRSILDGESSATAFIGYVQLQAGGEWSWTDGSPNKYNQLVSTTTTTRQTTTTARPTTTRSTVRPSDRRTPVSISILIDASVYTTTANSMNMITFYNELAAYISDRGDAEFAATYFGCNSQTCSQRADYSGLQEVLSSLDDTIMDNCLQTNPYSFDSGIKKLMDCYYYESASVPAQYDHSALIIFSSITDPSAINGAPIIEMMSNSAIITISVGPNAATLSSVSEPAATNINITDFSGMESLVKKVDQIIFQQISKSNAIQRMQRTVEDSEDAAAQNPVMCAYIDASDGFWYQSKCTSRYQMVCTGPEKEPVTTPNPALEKPCNDGYTFFKELNNGNCYKVSETKRSFANAQAKCQSELLAKSPQLISIQSSAEMEKIDGMLDSYENEGMFWIGLVRYDDSNPIDWDWSNGDVYDRNDQDVTALWKKGYPREALGANCVAYLYNDKKWINVDCQTNLRSICAYRFF